MPRWKALPDELDPQVKEFTCQLRRLVDRSGLGVAALADRTGYSRTSWERYLGGRLLAPKGAVVALAEVTGTNPVHLTTMWELAERAWSRAELRHDRTMEAIRIAQARAALGDFGAPAPGAELGGTGPDSGPGPGAGKGREGGIASGTPGARALGIAGPAGVFPTVPSQPSASDADAREKAAAHEGTPAPGRERAAGEGADGRGRAGAVVPGSPAPDSPVPGSPAQGSSTPGSPAPGTKDRSDDDPGSGGRAPREGSGSAPGGGTPQRGNSWGLAGYRGPSQAGRRGAGPAQGAHDDVPGTPPPAQGAHDDVPGTPPPGQGAHDDVPGTPPPGPHGEPQPSRRPQSPQPPRPAGTTPAPTPTPTATPGGGGIRRRQSTMFLAGLVGVLVVIGAVFYATGGDGGRGSRSAAKPPSPAVTTDPDLPPGVKCAGSGCTGKDAEAMGCSGELVTTARSVTVGTTVVEVRYSRTCGAAWGRITQAAQGDQVQVVVGARKETDTVAQAGDTIAYTPMVAVKDAAQARACVTLASGRKGCTR
ncbi:XRE family transcriptional regulator [Streptomyces mexicanus]|uniref:XRE family transcriptional regulator n=1 Tax=Streptomyces mexicanus TaxID=178566 RepID=UPI0031E54865